MTLRYLLDTHAAIWLLEGSAKLGSGARTAIEHEEAVSISDVSLLEVARLARRGTIDLQPNLESGLAAFKEKFVVIPIDASIAADAVALQLPQRDPFDRVITATARRRGLTLITKDRNIVDAGIVATLW